MKSRALIFLGLVALLSTILGCGYPGRMSGDGAARIDTEELNEDELSYDDGFPEGQHSPWWDAPGGQLAVVFTPTFYPATVSKARFLVGIGGVPTAEFRVRLFAGNLATGPDESRDLLDSEVKISAPFGNKWVEADMSDHDITIHSGEFSISMEWITPAGEHGGNAQAIGVDYTNPDGRSWWKTDAGSAWQRIEDVANIGDRDVMIRATIVKK